MASYTDDSYDVVAVAVQNVIVKKMLTKIMKLFDGSVNMRDEMSRALQMKGRMNNALDEY